MIFQPISESGLGVHIKSQYMDSLHVIDLGVAMHIAGNVLWHFTYTDILPGTPQQRLANIWSDIQQLYTERNTSSQFSNLTIKNFCDPLKPKADYPLLKGKGAEVRHIIPMLSTLWARHKRNDQYERHINALLQRMSSYYNSIDYKNDIGNFPFHLPTYVSIKICEDIDAMLAHYTWLAHGAMQNILF